MGIQNIQVLIEKHTHIQQHQAQVVALQAALSKAHVRGEHTPGNMRRECPLCQGR